ncbi:MAG: 3D domain-containing protein [Bacteroidota bacterium]
MTLRIISGRWEGKRRNYLYFSLGIVLVVVLTGIICYAFALDQVTLTVDGQRYDWKTLSPTVAKVLQEKQVDLSEGDEVHPPLSTQVKEDTKIEVIRGYPVEIAAAGKTVEFKTITRPVKEVLTKAKIKYDEDDIIKPGLEAIVEPGMKIRVINVRSEVITKQVAINPVTEYRNDKSLERGKRKTMRSGKTGLAEHQIQKIYQDGILTKETTISKKVIEPVINEIVAVGTKPVVRTLVTSRGSYRYVEAKVMEATAYYPGPESCGKWADGYTYTGKKAGYGVVAVDPKVIRLGTQLYIEGYGKAEAADIGGAIKGNKIDLCYETYQEALRFGRKKIKVYILE